MIRSVVQGCGSYLPERIVSNDELAKKVDTSDEWIRQRTGIRQRHIAAVGEFTSHLALKASERALAHAGIEVSDLDLIVLATATPDETFPATATRVQSASPATWCATNTRASLSKDWRSCGRSCRQPSLRRQRCRRAEEPSDSFRCSRMRLVSARTDRQ